MSMLALLINPPKIPDSVAPPEGEVKQSKKRGVKPGTYPGQCKAANAARKALTLARYRAVLPPGEWASTHVLESRLGYARSSVASTMLSWEKQGLVVKRSKGNRPFNYRNGYEWKWAE